MAVRYQDYYATLGVSRAADEAAIKKAYRKLARQYHPDVNKNAGAEARFKQIAEAYDVLSDPEKRKRYDTLGANWKNGQEFTPPQGWENVHFEFRGPRGQRGAAFEGAGGDFSDFFEALFGGREFARFGGEERAGGWAAPQRGEDHEAEITIPLEEACRGVRKTISLRMAEMGADRRVRERTRTFEVTIPPGTTDGARIRLGGQGARGHDGAVAGDLYLRVHLQPHGRFRVSGRDLEEDLPVTPWEAALGATVSVPMIEGAASVRLPPGTQGGQRIRLKGKGIPGRKSQGGGDLYAVVKIAVPKELKGRERELFEELGRISAFKPRQE